jgi:hypothetical protein
MITGDSLESFRKGLNRLRQKVQKQASQGGGEMIFSLTTKKENNFLVDETKISWPSCWCIKLGKVSDAPSSAASVTWLRKAADPPELSN